MVSPEFIRTRTSSLGFIQVFAPLCSWTSEVQELWPAEIECQSSSSFWRWKIIFLSIFFISGLSSPWLHPFPWQKERWCRCHLQLHPCKQRPMRQRVLCQIRSHQEEWVRYKCHQHHQDRRCFHPQCRATKGVRLRQLFSVPDNPFAQRLARPCCEWTYTTLRVACH